jgi:hypothetical protein
MILNLTQHPATPDQVAAGVVEPSAEQKAEIKELLTFNSLPNRGEIERRASRLAQLARKILSERMDLQGQVMIGGAPFLMTSLEKALIEEGLRPLYAFSKREVVEEVQGGKVVKKSVFKHAGFVKVGV